MVEYLRLTNTLMIMSHGHLVGDWWRHHLDFPWLLGIFWIFCYLKSSKLQESIFPKVTKWKILCVCVNFWKVLMSNFEQLIFMIKIYTLLPQRLQDSMHPFIVNWNMSTFVTKFWCGLTSLNIEFSPYKGQLNLRFGINWPIFREVWRIKFDKFEKPHYKDLCSFTLHLKIQIKN